MSTSVSARPHPDLFIVSELNSTVQSAEAFNAAHPLATASKVYSVACYEDPAVSAGEAEGRTNFEFAETGDSVRCSSRFDRAIAGRSLWVLPVPLISNARSP